VQLYYVYICVLLLFVNCYLFHICSWTKGYNNVRTEYISEDVICHKCGNCVKFISSDGRESFFVAPGEGGIALLAVHGINSVFAYTEHVVNPQIHIIKYPSLLKVTSLSGSYMVVSLAGLSYYQLV